MPMNKYSAFGMAVLFSVAVATRAQTKPADWVNPLIGTAQEGQTFPAAGVPFAMTQWTPATHDGEKKGVAPYYFADDRFRGFRGSHFLSGSATQEYDHGNEPSHHIGYLYDYAGAAPKTQEHIHEIVTGLYADRPNGLAGNDDAGQMSAWYIFSALGFYPVTPGLAAYAVGPPTLLMQRFYCQTASTSTSLPVTYLRRISIFALSL